MMQTVLESVYVYTGLPWWASIAIVATGIRLALLKPTIDASENTQKLQELQKDPRYIAATEEMKKVRADVSDVRANVSEVKSNVSEVRTTVNIVQAKLDGGCLSASHQPEDTNVTRGPTSQGIQVARKDQPVPEPQQRLPVAGRGHGPVAASHRGVEELDRRY